jgi:hypothetical protein
MAGISSNLTVMPATTMIEFVAKGTEKSYLLKVR